MNLEEKVMSSAINGVYNILAPLFTVSNAAYHTIEIILFVCMVVCSVFTILVVMFQPGNSDGVGAISGSETFFSKNDTSLEAKLKRLTIVSICVIIGFSVLFFLVASEILIGVGPVVVG